MSLGAASVPRARAAAEPAFELDRSSGVLLHVASLPGGRLGHEAYRFVDWLRAAGQSWWQILPLVPPDTFGSPYTSPSAFAGWPALVADPTAPVEQTELEDFRERQAYWIDDWARLAGGDAVAAQVRFEREWLALRRYAASRGVRLIGDLPIYVSRESAELAAHPGLFDTSDLAGVPPDLFTDAGQLWGHPLYDWPAHRDEGYRWWIERFRRTFELVDVTRIDHFRGFVAYWAVPADEPTAIHGRWRRGPGAALFQAIEGSLGRLPVVVEDLGVITPAVDRLRRRLGAPGMRVLQFGFSSAGRNRHHVAHHPEFCVVYTGTHDHDPIAAWYLAVAPTVKARVDNALRGHGLDVSDPAWGLIRLAFSSRARLAIVQMQDVLELGRDARLNTPGTVGGNWSWRLEPSQLTARLAERLRDATAAAGRLPVPALGRRESNVPPDSPTDPGAHAHAEPAGTSVGRRRLVAG